MDYIAGANESRGLHLLERGYQQGRRFCSGKGGARLDRLGRLGEVSCLYGENAQGREEVVTKGALLKDEDEDGGRVGLQGEEGGDEEGRGCDC